MPASSRWRPAHWRLTEAGTLKSEFSLIVTLSTISLSPAKQSQAVSLPHTWSPLLSAEQNTRSHPMLPNLQAGAGTSHMTTLEETTSWAGAWRLEWQRCQWAVQAQAGMTLAQSRRPQGWPSSARFRNYLALIFRASHFNLPKWQTAIIFKMTFIPV